MEKNIEFEEMKQQLRLLQQRLDKQVEINERQTRRAIDESLGSLRKRDERKFRLCLILAFVLPGLFLSQGLPVSFIVASFCLFLGNAAWRKYLNQNLEKIAGASLIETSKNLLKYKRDERNSILLGIPLGFLWCAWYLLKFSELPRFEGIDLTYLYLGVAAGTLLGLIIGLTRIYLPSMCAADRLLRQIEEVQSEK